ncbi:MAG: hypothetical protein WCK03_03830 [Candidatus Taylorbacteria bacterium]
MKLPKSVKRMWVLNFIVSILIVGSLLILSLFNLVEIAFSITFGILIITFNVVYCIIQLNKPENRLDERIKKIAYKSMSFAYQFSAVATSAFFVLVYFKLIQVDAAQALLMIIGIMYFSFLIPALLLRKFGIIEE